MLVSSGSVVVPELQLSLPMPPQPCPLPSGSLPPPFSTSLAHCLLRSGSELRQLLHQERHSGLPHPHPTPSASLHLLCLPLQVRVLRLSSELLQALRQCASPLHPPISFAPRLLLTLAPLPSPPLLTPSGSRTAPELRAAAGAAPVEREGRHQPRGARAGQKGDCRAGSCERSCLK